MGSAADHRPAVLLPVAVDPAVCRFCGAPGGLRVQPLRRRPARPAGPPRLESRGIMTPVSVIGPTEVEALLASLPRYPLATTPTPLQDASRLSAALGGPRILIKRDDL